MDRPSSKEYGEWYAGYVQSVPENNAIEALHSADRYANSVFNKLSETKGNYAYAEGKWSIKELITHISDAERIFQYRILRIAREPGVVLSGFDHDAYVTSSKANNKTLQAAIDEFTLVRKVSIALLSGIDPSDYQNQGVANDSPVSLRALGFIITGHQLHHFKVLEDKYL